jgi:hypothetical protein
MRAAAASTSGSTVHPSATSSPSAWVALSARSHAARRPRVPGPLPRASSSALRSSRPIASKRRLPVRLAVGSAVERAGYPEQVADGARGERSAVGVGGHRGSERGKFPSHKRKLLIT